MRCRSTKLPAPTRVLGNHRTSLLPRERAAGPHPTPPIPAPGADITLFLGVQYRFTSQGDSIAMARCGFSLPCATCIIIAMRISCPEENVFSLEKYFDCNATSPLFCKIIIGFLSLTTIISFSIAMILNSTYYFHIIIYCYSESVWD